jgi:hypothetical protein
MTDENEDRALAFHRATLDAIVREREITLAAMRAELAAFQREALEHDRKVRETIDWKRLTVSVAADIYARCKATAWPCAPETAVMLAREFVTCVREDGEK